MFDSNPDSSSLASSSFSQVLGWNELHGSVALIDYATAAQRLAPFIVEALGSVCVAWAVARTSLIEGDRIYEFMISVFEADGPLDFILLHSYFPKGDISKFQAISRFCRTCTSSQLWSSNGSCRLWKVFSHRFQALHTRWLYAGGGGNDERVGLC